MQNKASIIHFVYSQIYDQVISDLSGSFDENQSVNIKNEINYLSEQWSDYEERALAGLKKYSPFKFEHEQFNCYLVGSLPYTGFSDPLTIRISKNADMDLTITTIIHELIHIYIEPEESIYISKVQKAFPEIADTRILLHIAVNFIEYEILKSLFGKDKFDKIMKRELLLKGIRPAWDVVFNNEEKLKDII